MLCCVPQEGEAGVAGRDPKQEAAGPSGRKHVSSAMVEAWCKAAKANASPGAMHKLLQVLLDAFSAFTRF